MLGYVPAIIWTLIFVFLTFALCYQTLIRNRNSALSLLPQIIEIQEAMVKIVNSYPVLTPIFNQLTQSKYGNKAALLTLDMEVASIQMSPTETSLWLKFRNMVNDYQRARGQFHNLMKHQPMKMVAQVYRMQRLP